MNRVVNKTIKKTATPRTGRLIDAAASKSVSVSEGSGGGLSHSHVNKALIDLINQGLSTESSVQFKDVLASGAMTAGSANGAIPDDLPAATDTLFGVIKLGLSLIGSAGIANIRNRNYTTLSTYTDAAARMITSEIAIGSGTMVNTETISITLTNMPVSITKAPVGNIIANYSNWTGAGMKLSFARGGTYWLAFITNDLGTTITKDGIYISVQAMQLV